MKNIFITIEGIDGAGKSTIASMLAERIGAAHIKTPDARFSDDRQRIDTQGTIEEKYEFYISSLEKHQTEIRSLLKEKPIVCDRYIHSTIAYQWPTEEEPPNDIKSLFPKLTWPDLSVLLTVSKKVSRERISQREKETGIITTTDHNLPLLEKAHQRFISMPDLIQIDTSEKTPEQVCNLILLGILK